MYSCDFNWREAQMASTALRFKWLLAWTCDSHEIFPLMSYAKDWESAMEESNCKMREIREVAI